MTTRELQDAILEDFHRVRKQLGRNPKRQDYLEDPQRKFSKREIGAAFGGWNGLILASGMGFSAKGRINKQENRREYYEFLLKEIDRFRKDPIRYPPSSSLLVLGDLHAPFMHRDYPSFVIALSEKYRSDRVACVGDEVDYHAISFHDHDPDSLSPGHELEAAIAQLQPLYKAFPRMDIAESNHGSLVFRKAKHHGMPRQVISPYHDQLRAPPEWRWHFKIEVELSNGSFVDIHHSYGANVLAQSKKRGRSLIQGHHHNEAGEQWWGNDRQEFFAAFTGCGIDDVALAFAYNKNQVERPRLGALIVINGIPSWKPMIIDKDARWIGITP